MHTLTESIFDQEEFGSGPLAQATMTAPAINLWLVDDNRRLRATLSDLFARCDGIQCTATFPSPNAVLSALASRVGPDVILMDVHMGEANGLEAIRPIKALSRSTHVLMFTTCYDDVSEARALRSGASGFLLKSFPLERILGSIRKTRTTPSPHPKRIPLERRGEGEKSESLAPRQTCPPRTPALEGSRNRMLWVKRCLDLIRNRRN